MIGDVRLAAGLCGSCDVEQIPRVIDTRVHRGEGLISEGRTQLLRSQVMLRPDGP